MRRRGVILVASLLAIGIGVNGCSTNEEGAKPDTQQEQAEVLSGTSSHTHVVGERHVYDQNNNCVTNDDTTTNTSEDVSQNSDGNSQDDPVVVVVDDTVDDSGTTNTDSSEDTSTDVNTDDTTATVEAVSTVYKTGQSESFVSNDDGATQRGIVTSFQRDDASEVVIDNVNSLMWQDNSVVSNTHTWSNARSYCENLTFANQSDWRLPEAQELATILVYGKIGNSTDDAFQNGLSFDFWTNSSYYFNPDMALNIFSGFGYTDVSYKTKEFRARCVRGQNSTLAKANFVRESGDVVRDLTTKLMWQDNSDAKNVELKWENAIQYCQDLTLGGYGDWRLPNKNELSSILDIKTNEMINPVFQNYDKWIYFTSTTLVQDNTHAWGVKFQSGRDFVYPKNWVFNVRCVREGE